MALENILKLMSPYRVSDEKRAMAYESVPATTRGEIKQTIARLFTFWGKSSVSMQKETRLAGFSAHEEYTPAPLAFVVCNAQKTAGSHAIAALLPAILAHVPHIIPCYIHDGKSPFPEEHLLGLELLGLDDAYCLTCDELAKILEDTVQLPEQSRAVFVGSWFGWEEIAPFVIAQNTHVQFLHRGENVYPSLPPTWFTHHQITFTP